MVPVVDGLSPLASLTPFSSSSTLRIKSHAKLDVRGSGAGIYSFSLRYKRDDTINGPSSSTRGNIENGYNLGLKAVIYERKKEEKEKQKQKRKTEESSASDSASIPSSTVMKGDENDTNTNNEKDYHPHNTQILFQLDDDNEDNKSNKKDISKLIMEKEDNNKTWITTDSVLDMIRNQNERKKYMESLLNITMPNPSDYTFATGTNANETKKTTPSSLALSLMDSFINTTTNNIATNTQKGKNKKQIATGTGTGTSTSTVASTPISAPQQSLESLINITTTISSEMSKNTTNDLYALATSLMTKTPKMKRTVRQPPSPSSSPPPKRSTVSNSLNLNPDTPLTINDLERILSDSGYVRRDELTNLNTDGVNGSSGSGGGSSGITTSSKTKNYQNKSSTILNSPSSTKGKMGSTSGTSTSSGGGMSGGKGVVAFPQASILSTKYLRIGTSISSSIFAILISSSIQPNLWLIGSIIGAILGNDIAEKTVKIDKAIQGNAMDVLTPTPGGLYGDVSLKLGRRIAETYLKIWDFIQGFWFMYRTGQLSYEYYKSYETLDQKFQIQNKMDAWNARFVEGKKNFDEWERENEIGRKVLAGLRTVWMVEENSYRSQKYRIQKGRRIGKISKYRVVQYAIDIGYWFKRFFLATWNAITGGGNNELVDVLNGIKIQMRELNLEIISQRMGAAVAALILVNIVGAMFALTPPLLGVMAVIAGMIWPSWVGSAYQKVKDLIEETRARGRGEIPRKAATTNNKTPSNIASPMVEKKNFHFFMNEKGRKQWYRTGQSMFSKIEEKKSDNVFSFWPFNDSEKPRR